MYPSNLTNQQWEIIRPLIPDAKTGGKKIKGRKRQLLVDSLGLVIRSRLLMF
ncbi:hypothetical protein [Roseofilum casamattae]|uniref:Transposase n=1 Tax=Roseofilum casamattae BLCC-M143 TaxID=3022442 RepID=A0ABT7BTZ3_9CYAN|nr:hypothetical protein [Roseofilum casamattae]MDJ1182655.1 hypothetical protein [Roseofilum casamattae BLCC-M143]